MLRYEDDTFMFENYFDRQWEWSEKTFGPGERTVGVVNHIKEELDEILAVDGKDVIEWVDVIILAMDGARRSGFTIKDVIFGLIKKQNINFKRKWPDWREFTNGEAIKHIKET